MELRMKKSNKSKISIKSNLCQQMERILDCRLGYKSTQVLKKLKQRRKFIKRSL